MNGKSSLLATVVTIFALLSSPLHAESKAAEQTQKKVENAENKGEIDTQVNQALQQFYALNPRNKELAEQAAGVLIFPRVTKGGVGVAGEYGEGVLQVKGATVGYYNIKTASIGLTVGIAKRSEILLFMTQKALDEFKRSNGWKIGVDAEVALVSVGAGGQYDSKTLQKPILGFIFGEQGLLADLSLAGSKITKMPQMEAGAEAGTQ